MPKREIKLSLDFSRKDNFPKFEVKQFDSLTLNITPLENGVAYSTANCTAKLYVGSYGEVFEQETDITVNDNNIIINVDRNLLSKQSTAYAEIELTDNLGIVTSATFTFNIVSKIGEGATIPGQIDGFVTKYEKLISEFKNQVDNAVLDSENRTTDIINNVNINVDNKINDIETRFQTLTTEQQQDAEVIEARKGENSLKAKMDKIDEQFNTITSEKADKITTNNIQGQINNLVLESGGDSNLEVVQARATYDLLNERLLNIENSENIKFGDYTEQITSKVVKSSSTAPSNIWNSSLAPYYYTDNTVFKGKYITKIAFKVGTANTPLKLSLKIANSHADIIAGDQTVDKLLVTITPTDTNWNEYDLTKSDSRIVYSVPNSKGLYIPTNCILALGTKNDGCTAFYNGGSNDSEFLISQSGQLSSNTLGFIISINDGSTATNVVKIRDGLMNKFDKDISRLSYKIDGGTSDNLYTAEGSTVGGYYSADSLSWIVASGITQLGFLDLLDNTKSITIKIPTTKISGTHQYVFKNSEGTIFTGGKCTGLEEVTIQVPIGAKSVSFAMYTGYPLEIYFNYKAIKEQLIIGETSNKYISILGDSISTFKGYVPTGNAVFFDGTNGGITNASMTWWHSMITNLESKLCMNNSWSGSRVTTTAGSDSSGCMTRCENLHNGDIMPDIIIVYMGINDFNNNVPIGTYDGSQAFPTTTTTFRDAYAIMLNKILTKYVNAKVYVCTLPYCDRNTDENEFPEKNANSVQLATWNNAIRELAHLFGVEIIEMSKCGITFQNRKSFLFDDLHPNSTGMQMLRKKAENTIRYNS